MRRLRRRLRSWRFLVVFTTLLALCAAASYAAYALAAYVVTTAVEHTVDENLSSYRNTSPPLTATADGVTLSVAHSRYLILDTITVTLTNHSSAPIYVPGEGAESMSGARSGLLCWESQVEHLSAHGWQSVGSGCGWFPPGCGGGAAQGAPYPTTGIVAPGQTIILDSYDGQYSYPPLTPGSYRFSVAYTLTPIQQTWPLVNPKSVTLVKLTTAPVTVSSAPWIPSWYHQHLDCPRMPA